MLPLAPRVLGVLGDGRVPPLAHLFLLLEHPIAALPTALPIRLAALVGVPVVDL